MLQCWLYINIGVQTTAYEWYECIMRLHLTAERWITACSSGHLRFSEHGIGMQDKIWCNGWDCRLTLLWQWLVLRNCVFLTRAFNTICSSYTVGIGHWGKSDVDSLGFVKNFRGSRYVVGGSLPVSDWAAEQRLQFGFSLFELSWWKSVHTIYLKIWVFGGPNIPVSQNVVNSDWEALWI